jgi:predicted RNA-binding protein with RPS1 domain
MPRTDAGWRISALELQGAGTVDFHRTTMQDICKEGDEMLVKVIGIDRASGKIRLSRREAIGKTPDVVHNFRTAAPTT